jgi:hypothetical protein
MTAQQYRSWKTGRANKLRAMRIVSVAGVVFLTAYWFVPATPKPMVEAQKQEVVANTGFGISEKVEPSTTLIATTQAPTPTPKSDEIKIKEWLTAYGSPMTGYAKYYVQMGTKYGVDPKIMVAISYTESSAGKSLCHGETNGHNAHGLLYRYKNPSTGKITRECIEFGSYENEIEYVAKLLGGSIYKGAGKTTIAQIGTKYDPISEGVANPNWVNSTQTAFNQINNK